MLVRVEEEIKVVFAFVDVSFFKSYTKNLKHMSAELVPIISSVVIGICTFLVVMVLDWCKWYTVFGFGGLRGLNSSKSPPRAPKLVKI